MTPNHQFREIIQAEQLSQAEAARLLGITRGAVNNMLKDHTYMSYERLFEYAEILGYEIQISINKKSPAK